MKQRRLPPTRERPHLIDLETARHVLRVSVPLLFGMVGNLIFLLVDRICLARYSEDTLQASGPAVFTATTVIVLTTGVVGITRSYVAQAHGRGDARGAIDEGANGLVLGMILALLLVLSTPLLMWVPTLGGHPPHIQELESQYLGLSTLFGAVMTVTMALSSYFNGTERTRIPMTVGIIGQAVGVIMTIGLVFGRFGLPELGMRGSALGTLSAVLVMLVGYVVLLPQSCAAGLARLVRQGGKRAVQVVLLRLRRGAPAGGSLSLEELGQTAFVWLAGGLGAVALGANNVALAVNYAAVIPLIGLGLGCNILCGTAVGAGLHTDIPRIMRVTLVISGLYVAVVAFFQIVTPTLLLGPFGLDGSDPATTAHAIDVSRVLWTYSAAFMFSMVGSAVLECLGLARFAFLARLGVMWCLCVPALVIIVVNNRDDADLLPALWLVFSAFEAVMAGLCLWRVRRAVRNEENLLHSTDRPRGAHDATDTADAPRP
ncbi:MATE family efflux transporter [Sanguibacter antarcticus]|uniref:Probable multidrug resistance protein NorM n=1 Tax=Sanguibacter antarcticus TaxID=372484 RepID=A0A2A9E6G6_9MICO|nr:MATE family efflux transporter [Sanguibacter antarcticus]PFG34647.1 MATE family multidrug resistance protein [Sanguibacter antarcticus]